MARRWVALLLCVSALATAHADGSSPPVLAQEELSQPDTVVGWLRDHEARADVYGAVRQRDKSYRKHWERDLGEAQAIYRAALAADTVLKRLTDRERQQIQRNADCLADYIKSSKPSGACPPLQLYGMPNR